MHIGWPKSGTTSLQHALRGWPNLAGKPLDRDGGDAASETWSALLTTPAFDPDVLDGLITESCRDPDLPVIASYEAIVGVPFTHHGKGGHVGCLTAADRITATRHDLGILASLRDPRSMLRSTYLQEVSKGSPHSYAQFLRSIRSGRTTGTHPFNFANVLTRYADRIGPDRVVVCALEDLRDRPHDSWGQIAARVDMAGLKSLGDVPLEHSNTAMVLSPSVELFVNRRVLPVDGRALARRLRRTVYTPIRTRLATADHPDAYFLGDPGHEDELVDELDHEFATIFTAFGLGSSPPRNPG